MKTDINGVPWTYENKDELVFDPEEDRKKPIGGQLKKS